MSADKENAEPIFDANAKMPEVIARAAFDGRVYLLSRLDDGRLWINEYGGRIAGSYQLLVNSPSAALLESMADKMENWQLNASRAVTTLSDELKKAEEYIRNVERGRR